MKKLIGLTWAILFLFTTSLAVAGEATSALSWEAPTTRVDGTPLAINEIQGYKAFYEVDGLPTLQSSFEDIDATTITATIVLDLQPRPEPYVVSFALVAIDTDGRQSELSQPVSKSFVVASTAPPGPPTNLVITISIADGFTITEVTPEE